MKTLPAGAELFHADRRTDLANVRVSFRNYATASKIVWCFYCAVGIKYKFMCTL